MRMKIIFKSAIKSLGLFEGIAPPLFNRLIFLLKSLWDQELRDISSCTKVSHMDIYSSSISQRDDHK
jgi:hypothetical protein